jgi:hypothetical protein
MSHFPLRRSLVGVAVTVALAAGLLAVASPAKAGGYSPVGVVDTVNGVPAYYAFPEGAPYISGWALDPDFAWLGVTVRADFTWYRNYCRFPSACVAAQTSVTQLANYARSDIQPLFGTRHGFYISVPPLPALTWYDYKTVCVTALDAWGGGADTSLGCYKLPF